MPMERKKLKQGKCYIDAHKDRYKILPNRASLAHTRRDVDT
jgi:hypothetical protein